MSSESGSSHHKRPKKAEHPPAEEGEGNWIMSYADMMTLLCVFFIIMFSLAKPDPKKVEQAKKETAKFMGGEYKEPHQELVKRMQKLVAENDLSGSVDVESDESGVVTTFRGTVFFDSGKAELIDKGQGILTKMGEIIRKEAPGFRILVEGHTDDTPIASSIFPSNWELSGARASRVIRLFETQGFDRSKLTYTGYGDTRPVVPNRTPAGEAIPDNQSKNRRVVIRILKGDSSL